LAPSTVNLQPWSFAVFTPASWREMFGRPLPFGGDRAVIVMGNTHRVRSVLDAFPQSPMVEYTLAVMNASLAAMNMNIAAEALGVSSVMLSETGRTASWIPPYLKEKLGAAGQGASLMTIVLGYPRGSAPPHAAQAAHGADLLHGPVPGDRPGRDGGLVGQMKAGYWASHPLSSLPRSCGYTSPRSARRRRTCRRWSRASLCHREP